MNKKIFPAILVLILLVIPLILAEIDTGYEEQMLLGGEVAEPIFYVEFDYTNGDYSQLQDWTLVKWDKIPADRIEEIPAEQVFNYYDKLDADQLKGLKSEQISKCFEKIEDLSKDVNLEEAQAALRTTYGVEVKLEEGKPMNIRNGILATTFGNKDHVDVDRNYVYQTGMLTVDDKGNIVFTPLAHIKNIEISSTDSVTVDASEGAEFRACNAIGCDAINVVGMIRADKGNIIIPSSTVSGVTTIEDFSLTTEEDIIVYTDEKVFANKPDEIENYLLLTSIVLRAGTSESNQFVIEPEPGNEMLRMQKRQYTENYISYTMVPDDRDFFRIELTDGANVEIVDRTISGLTPLLTYSDSGKLKIENGKINFKIKDGTVSYEQTIAELKDRKITNPEEFFVESVAMEMANQKDPSNAYVVSSSNRFAAYTKDKADWEQVARINVAGLSVSNVIEDNKMQTIEDLRAKYGKVMKFSTEVPKEIKDHYPDGHDPSANMVQIIDKWMINNPTLRKKVDEFSLSPVWDSAAQVSKDDNGIVFLGEAMFDAATYLAPSEDGEFGVIRDIKDVLSIINHEATHIVYDKQYYIAEKGVPYEEGTYGTIRDVANSAAEEAVNSEEFAALDRMYADFKNEFEQNKDKLQDPVTLLKFIQKSQYCKQFLFPGITSLTNPSLTYNALNVMVGQIPSYSELRDNYQAQVGRVDEARLVNFYVGYIESWTTEVKPLQAYKSRLDDIVYKVSGVYPYSFKDYEMESGYGASIKGGRLKKDLVQPFLDTSKKLPPPRYYEFPTTIMEQDRDVIRRGIAQGNSAYEQMTRLNYKLGAISEEEYNYLMGRSEQ